MEQVLAQRRFNDVRKLANSLVFEVHDSIKDLAGATPARKIIVSKALEYLDSLAKDAGNDPSLLRELAMAYQRVGDVQGGSLEGNLGDTEGAVQSYNKAVQIREALARKNPHDLQLQRELAGSYNQFGMMEQGDRNYPAALEDYRKSLAIMTAVAAASTDTKVLNQFAGAHYFLASALAESGDLNGALEHQKQATVIRESIKATDRAGAFLTQAKLAGDYGSLAQFLRLRKEFGPAIQNQRKALAIVSELLRSDPQNATIRMYVGMAYEYLGLIFESALNLEQAGAAYEKAAIIYQSLERSDPLNAQLRIHLAFIDSHMGEIEVQNGAAQLGFRHLRQAISLWERDSRAHPDDRGMMAGRADAYLGMGRAYSAMAGRTVNRTSRVERWRQARVWLEKSSQLWNMLLSEHALMAFESDQPELAAKALAECQRNLAVPQW